MYRYYQTGEKSKWTVINDSKDVTNKVLKNGGKKLTILAVSEDINEDTITPELKYKGPFYADIDVKEGIATAATSALSLVDKLKNRDVPEEQIQIFASGSKGFHVIVNEYVFSSGRAIRNLPAIYKEMAMNLYVHGMDMQVYSGGKGNCWRLENLQRYDGNYRVRVTTAELKEIAEDASVYKGYVSGPRELLPPPKSENRASGMEVLFEGGKTSASKKANTPEPIESEKLKSSFAEELPQCIQDMREGKIKPAINFNRVALSVSTFISRAGLDEAAYSSLITRLAENVNSETYPSNSKKAEHIEGLVKYVGTLSKYQFSCASMRACVNSNPCEGCPLNSEDSAEDEASEDLGIAILSGSYFRLGGKEPVRLTTFSIAKQYEIRGPSDEDPNIWELKGVTCDIVTMSGASFSRVIPESAWKSKSTFLTMLEGIPEAVFLGSDLDIQKIKFMVFNDGEEMDQIYEVPSAGIHFDYQYGAPLPVYVEPGLSVNKFGVQGTHSLNREIPNPPNMQSISIGEDSVEKAAIAFELLLEMNHPSVMGFIIGWFASAHIKGHITKNIKVFPLLSIWGNAGSGKTKTIEVAMWLSGAGSEQASSLSLAHATKFPIVEYGTTTTTIPRVFEEFNKSKMAPKMFDYVHEYFKTAWDGGSATRGALGGGSSTDKSSVNARTISIPIISPMVYLSEQPIDSPPLKQRSIPIGMNAKGRNKGSKAFKKLEKVQKDLEPMAKMLTLKALQTSVSRVGDMLEVNELEQYAFMEPRPRKALQVVLTGMDFIRELLVEVKFPIRTVRAFDRVRELVDADMDNIVKDIANQATKTEVDMVLEDMALMAYLHSSNTIEGLEEGKHFHVLNGRLLIDLIVAHALYRRYKRSEGGSLVIDSPAQMMRLIRTEVYFVSDSTIPDMVGSKRKLVELDLDKMAKKGLEVNLFAED